jgi:hypothetical protein
MGKRELVLIVVFVALGFVVYQFTAPPPPPGSEGVSIAGIFRNIRRGVRGARETATAEVRQTVPVDPTVQAIRINVPRPSDVTITGEDRADIAVEMHTTGRGYDPAEAKANADATKLKIERVGDAMVATLDLSGTRAVPQGPSVLQVVITLTVPRRLALRMEPHVGRFIASRLASAEIMGSRGDTRMTGIAGRLQLTHSGGTLEVDGAGSLKLNARNSRSTVKQVAGPMTVDTMGGELKIADVAGPLEIDARNTEIRIDDIKGLKAPLRINSLGGELRIEGLRTEARLDGRNTLIEVALAASAPVTIYSLGEIRVTAPPGGYTLDAVATEGRINVDDGEIKPSEGPDPHAAGPVRGGGPTLTLRATRGSITVRQPTAGK